MADITYKQGAVLAVSYSGLAKVFSFVSSLLLAWLFGANEMMDIYFYIILACTLLNGWLQAITSTVIVPEFMHLRQNNPRAAITFANFFIYLLAALALIIILIFYLFPAQALGLISAFADGQIYQYRHFAILGAAYFGSFLLMSFLLFLAESYKIFTLYKLTLLNTALPLIFLIITRRAEAMFAGFITAYVLQIIVCLALLKKRAGWFFNVGRPQFSQKFKHNFWNYQPNNLLWTALAYAPLFLISGFGTGIVSMYNYSRMIADSPADVLINKVSNIARIKMSSEAAADNKPTLAATFLSVDKILLFILMPVCIFTAAYAREVVQFLFVRGNFTQQTAGGTTFFLQFFMLALPLSCLAVNYHNLSSSLRIIKETAFRFSVLAALFIGFYIFAAGAAGPFSVPIVFLVLQFAVLLINNHSLRQFMPFVNYRLNLIYAGKLAVFSLLCAAAGNLLLPRFESAFWTLLMHGSFFFVRSILISHNKRKGDFFLANIVGSRLAYVVVFRVIKNIVFYLETKPKQFAELMEFLYLRAVCFGR